MTQLAKEEQRYREVETLICEFCDNCTHCTDCGGYVEFWGAPVYQHEVTCVADFYPENKACPEHDEYQALVEELEALDEYFEVEEATA